MKKCPFCAEDIQDAAIVCKHCGRDLPQPAPVNPRSRPQPIRPRLLLSLILGAVAIYAFVSYNLGDLEYPKTRTTAPERVSGKERMAFIQSQHHVERELKSPATADFPLLDFESVHLGGGVYRVRSYVDAQNGFGATIRNNWTAKIRYKGGEAADGVNWELLELTVGGRRVVP